MDFFLGMTTLDLTTNDLTTNDVTIDGSAIDKIVNYDRIDKLDANKMKSGLYLDGCNVRECIMF